MSKLFGVAGLLLGAAFLGTGGPTAWEQVGNRTPRPITFAQFQAQKPTQGHFRVSGATLCVPEAIWIENQLSGTIGNIYIPVRANAKARDEDELDKPVTLLVKVDDPHIAAAVAKIKGLDPAKPAKERQAARAWAQSHIDDLFISRPLEGVLAEGVDALDSDEKRLLESSDTQLDKNFVILEEHTGPQFGPSLALIFMGGGLFTWGLLRLRGRAQNI